MLNWSLQDLADETKVSYETIRRAERADNKVPSIRVENLIAIQRALERGGIVFFDSGETRPGGAGIRLKE